MILVDVYAGTVVRPRPVVGILQRDPVGLYAEQWLGGVDAARAYGCDLICFFGSSLDEPGWRHQANTLYDLVTEKTVDGLIVWTTALGVHVGQGRMAAFCGRFAGLPMVTVEERVGDNPVVLMAERRAMDEAVSHLIEVHGHRRIAFVRGALTHPGAQRRYQGYRDAMARHGLAAAPDLVSPPLPDPGLVAGAVTALLRSAHRPDAIVTAHDDFAVCILSTLRAAGVGTPQDVAVIGFDDRIDLLAADAIDSMRSAPDLQLDRADDRPDLIDLSLTTVRAPFYEMGRRAVETVLGLIRGDTVPDAVEIPADLVVRRTCGCPSGAPILSTPRELTGDPTDAPRYAGRVPTETAEKYWRYGQVLGERRSQLVREVGYELITAPDMAAVGEVLGRELSKLGIPSCYLATYEPTPSRRSDLARTRARLPLAYEHGAPVHVATDATVFPSALLVPGDRLPRTSPSSLVALPLYFRDQQLGFALFELGPRIGWIYTTLQEQLSVALHRALLIESDRAAMAAVEEVHRRAERHRLAGELHDSISQALFSMTLHTRALQLAIQQDGADPDGRLARGVAELRDLTQTALAETRALILEMRPESLHEEGLVVTLRRHAASVAAREGLDFRFRAPEGRLNLDEGAQEELLRVVQEAVHNSVKHARARRIQLSLLTPVEPVGTLVVEIADDGTGFDPDLPRPGHLGLHIMRERVERMGGRLTVDSAPSRSTTIRAILPGVLAEDAPDPG
jgi:signal transduction histidine kinase/DNA-binding LacI/PurR family transcriptional regulator